VEQCHTIHLDYVQHQLQYESSSKEVKYTVIVEYDINRWDRTLGLMWIFMS